MPTDAQWAASARPPASRPTHVTRIGRGAPRRAAASEMLRPTPPHEVVTVPGLLVCSRSASPESGRMRRSCGRGRQAVRHAQTCHSHDGSHPHLTCTAPPMTIGRGPVDVPSAVAALAAPRERMQVRRAAAGGFTPTARHGRRRSLWVLTALARRIAGPVELLQVCKPRRCWPRLGGGVAWLLLRAESATATCA